MIRCFQEHHPIVHEAVWVAEDAIVVGAVEIQAKSSIWFHSVIRSEEAAIVIKTCTNIQDNCVLHTDDQYPCIVGNRVTIGHQSIIHGCEIGDDTLVGMGSIIMNGALIGARCIIGAGTLITEHMQIPDDCVVVGSPGRVMKQTTAQQIEATNHNATHYYELAMQYQREEQVWKNMY